MLSNCGLSSQVGQKQIPPDDAHVCYRLRVDRDWIKTVERIFPESEKFINELVVSCGWRDEWLQDEELCPNQVEMQATMTSFARMQSETLLELIKQNPSIKVHARRHTCGSACGGGG